MLNSCHFIGNLAADPEIRSFQSGGRVANFRLGCNERWKDRDGNRKERVEWVSIAVYSDGLVGVVERYLRKGSKVFICGKLTTRKWTDQSGADRYSTEIVLQGPQSQLVMLDGAPGGDRGERQSSGDSWGNSQSGDRTVFDQNNGGWADQLDDELPPF